MADGGNSRSGGSVRLAYLCNLYPAVSHSFVRREIAGVEQAGHEVHRFSLRPPRADLKDEADLAEAARTEVVLAQGGLRLAFAAVVLLLAGPARTFRAARAASRLSGPGFNQKFRHLAYWLEAAWLVRRLEELDVEHVHAHFGTNPAAVALIVRAWGGPPFSFTAHGPDEFDAPITLSLSQKVAAARFVAAISSFGRSQLMRWSNPSEWDKIHVIPCGVDKSFLEQPHHPVPAESIEFVCVARLAAQKGMPLLIAACERLRATGAGFTLTIIGDGELRGELEAEIRERRLDDRISLAGTCTSAEIRQRLLRARAFVLPSFAEGLPVVIMEALALARPVVTTAIAGIPELVDSECGWVIPAGSEDALVEALSRALRASADELAAKGECGRTRVHQMHHAGKNALLMSALMTGNSA
jgi:glycosyltransferase involved in cell wall biosynthesis